MKNIIKISLIGLAIMVLLAGCGNDRRYVYTKINEDCSIYREFIENGDSAFMVGDTAKDYPFLVRIDSSWKVTWFYGNDTMPYKFIEGWPLKKFTLKLDSTHFLKIKLSKTFKNIDELNGTFSYNRLPWFLKIKQDFYLNKKFRWFYTYYDYSEVFKKLNPNPQTKISDFFTQEEIAQYFGENTDFTKGRNGVEILNYLKGLEEKSELWVNKCYYDAYFDILINNFKRLKTLKIDSVKFASLKPYLFDSLENKKDFEKDSIFFASMDKYFNTKLFVKNIWKKDTIIKKEIEDKSGIIAANLDLQGQLDFGLSMPGKVIKTNSVEHYGDTLTWRVNSDRFLFSDYKIYAKSRKPNYWAFAVTGLIVLLGVLGLWIKRK